MAEDLKIAHGKDKTERYDTLYKQLQALIKGEEDTIANLGNIAAGIMETFQFLWVGFYRVSGDTLILGPFQGPIACTRIKKGKGVCGTAWKEKKTIVVEDVNQFQEHIFCSSLAQSEIVIPIFDKKGDVQFVLDIDSAQKNTFNQIDKEKLEKVGQLVETISGLE